MPIEPFEMLKLAIGLILITIPGYFWSFIFSKKLTTFERITFGFVVSLGLLTLSSYFFVIVFKFTYSFIFLLILYLIYTLPVIILYLLSIEKFGLPKIKLKPIKMKYFLLIGILIFISFMVFLPHILNNHYLPFHVDEWIHWSYSKAVIETGKTAFTNPYTGGGITASPEVGFHISTACIHYLSGSNLLTIFLFMPTIMSVLSGLIVFNIGERSKKKYGLEAAFLIAFIPTTARYLGPKFYVAVAMGLLLLIFTIWLAQLKIVQATPILSMMVLFTFFVHPVTALVIIIFLLIYSAILLLHKKYKISFLTGIFSLLPFLIFFLLSTRWSKLSDEFFKALAGEEYILELPRIWISFEHLGILTWVLFIIGTYFSFTRGKSLKKTLSFLALVLIVLIGLYDRFGYGYPIIYERTFLYLFVPVILIAAFGLSELRHSISDLYKNDKFKDFKNQIKNINLIAPIAICLVILIIGVNAHASTQYYEMINENDYETFIWINDNIDRYRDENNTIKRGLINPFKASPFSAITGLNIISSNMHPIYGIKRQYEVKRFLNDKCRDTSFLNKYKIGLVYGKCENENLTKVYENVYLYLR